MIKMLLYMVKVMYEMIEMLYEIITYYDDLRDMVNIVKILLLQKRGGGISTSAPTLCTRSSSVNAQRIYARTLKMQRPIN